MQSQFFEIHVPPSLIPIAINVLKNLELVEMREMQVKIGEK
jgi:hypothetical protein